MLTPDTQILSVVQIALIGILVVIGMFLLWRKIQRVEQKLESWIAASNEHGFCHPGAISESMNGSGSGYETKPVSQQVVPTLEETLEDDMEMMQNIFQDEAIPDTSAAFMVFSPFGYSVPTSTPSTNATSEVKSVKIEEITPPPVQTVQSDKKDEDNTSETPTDKGPLTKTKVLRMNVDSLKEVLLQHGLSTEGTRRQLIDRIYENNVVH